VGRGSGRYHPGEVASDNYLGGGSADTYLGLAPALGLVRRKEAARPHVADSATETRLAEGAEGLHQVEAGGSGVGFSHSWIPRGYGLGYESWLTDVSGNVQLFEKLNTTDGLFVRG